MSEKNWAEALIDFLDDGDKDRSSIQKFLAAFSGSSLVHVSMIMAASLLIRYPLTISVYFSLLIYTVAVSLVVSVIVATGVNGRLVRRFWYGVSLPMACYFLAVSLLYFYGQFQNIIEVFRE
ncbi:MAG: hypothetical protein OXH50_05780 [Gemmatimonadetes bacterium]|nr:hypothetical protein [Gemmatimonadota bacterium]